MQYINTRFCQNTWFKFSGYIYNSRAVYRDENKINTADSSISYTLTMSTKEGVERCFSRLRRPSSSRDAVRASIARCLFRFFFHWNTRSAASVWSAGASFSGGRRPLKRQRGISFFQWDIFCSYTRKSQYYLHTRSFRRFQRFHHSLHEILCVFHKHCIRL